MEEMRSHLIYGVISVSIINHTLLMPHKVEVGPMIYRGINMSPLIRKTLFRESFKKLKQCENASVNKQLKPGYIHFSSPSRLSKVYKLDRTCFASHMDNWYGQNYVVTSLANLVCSDRSKQVKAYGWSESDKRITCIFNSGKSTDTARLISFPRHVLKAEFEEQAGEVSNRNTRGTQI